MDFQKHLEKYLSNEEINQLISSFSLENKHAALLNIKKMSDEKFLSLYPNAKKHPIVPHAYIYDKNEYDLGKSLYHELGCFYLQEPSAMLPSYYLNPNKDDIVLDLCAAPGGKSIQASFLMNNQGLIISNDLSYKRTGAILENVTRLGLGNIVITNNDFSLIDNKFNNFFSKIILDAPCSGSGMFRKDQKMIDDWSYNKVLKFQEIQKQLIVMSYHMLKEGGMMVYSTCSYSYEEDEEVIEYLLNNTDAEIIPIEENKYYYISKLKPYGIHLFPSKFEGEGHYLCLIRKPGNLKIKQLEPSNLYKYKNIYIDKNIQNIDRFSDTLFAQTLNIELPKGLNIIRKGIKLGEYSKDIFKYDYHYGRYLDNFDNIVNISKGELEKYMSGNPLNITCARGYALLKYEGISVSFTKSDGKMLKNHYPKILRK